MKKLIAIFVTICFVCTLAIGGVGCTPEKPKTTTPADKKDADKDKKDADKDKKDADKDKKDAK